MKTTNNTDASKWVIHWDRLSLVLLHLIVFVWSAISEPVFTTEMVAKTLPQDICSDSV